MLFYFVFLVVFTKMFHGFIGFLVILSSVSTGQEVIALSVR